MREQPTITYPRGKDSMNIETQVPTIPTRPNWRGRALLRLMEERGLHAVYQPILDQRQGRYFAFEALIRGPENSELHTPAHCSPPPMH